MEGKTEKSRRITLLLGSWLMRV